MCGIRSSSGGVSCPCRQSVDDTENLDVNLVFLETDLSQHLLIPLSILDVWGHMRTLCLSTGHPGRNATISIFYTYEIQIKYNNTTKEEEDE